MHCFRNFVFILKNGQQIKWCSEWKERICLCTFIYLLFCSFHSIWNCLLEYFIYFSSVFGFTMFKTFQSICELFVSFHFKSYQFSSVYSYSFRIRRRVYIKWIVRFLSIGWEWNHSELIINLERTKRERTNK